MHRAFLLLLAVACSRTTSAPAPPGAEPVRPSGSTGSTTATAPFAIDDPDAPPLCGCALCQPVVSTDPCKTDDDCAPAAACHATTCIAKSKAPPKAPDGMCTLNVLCNTVDSNHCGCWKGSCALVPSK